MFVMRNDCNTQSTLHIGTPNTEAVGGVTLYLLVLLNDRFAAAASSYLYNCLLRMRNGINNYNSTNLSNAVVTSTSRNEDILSIFNQTELNSALSQLKEAVYQEKGKREDFHDLYNGMRKLEFFASGNFIPVNHPEVAKDYLNPLESISYKIKSPVWPILLSQFKKLIYRNYNKPVLTVIHKTT